MKLGMLMEIQIPRPWGADHERRAYQESTEQVVLADQVGFDYAWAVEHHFLAEYSHCSAPEVWLGALSQRTERIRLGHGVALAPRGFNHAIRIAERVAVLDILTGGRVDLGLGRSITPHELGGFEIDGGDAKPMLDEALKIIPRSWTEEPFSYDGDYYHIPPRSVLPKPITRPHPPLWLAGTQPSSFAAAGRKGVGCLAFVMGTDLEKFAQQVAGYRAAIGECEPVGAFVNNQLAIAIPAYCGETTAEAHTDARESVEWVLNAQKGVFGSWKQLPTEAVPSDYAYYARNRRAQEGNGRRLGYEDFDAAGIILVGDPVKFSEGLKRIQACGVDQVILILQMGPLAHDKIMASIRRIGEHVIPQFTPAAVAAAQEG